ncbi:hypothetical protein F4779DRAFT_579009 [Xylariaceae sp. FL0662B]|nr:hypothetical protein F4779DRAFT_579009 [Xylariaceae sp. FL0662B]
MTESLSNSTEVQHDAGMAEDSISLDEEEEHHSLGPSYSNCLNSYRRFLVQCSRNPSISQSPGLEKCFEEYSRLKLWGDQKQASLPPSVPGSLSATIQDAELRQTVVDIFEQIIESFQQLVPLIPSCSEEFFSYEEDEELDCDSDDSSGDGSQTSSQDARPPQISHILGHIFENVDELYRLGSLLGRLRLAGRYLHSTRPVSFVPSQQDYQHVRQKFLLWRRQQIEEDLEKGLVESPRPAALKEEEEEEPVTPEYISKRQEEEDLSYQLEYVLSRRLATANVKRRLQFRYWDAHPYRPEEGIQPIEFKTSQVNTPNKRDVSIDRQSVGNDNTEFKSVQPPQTAHSFSTVAKTAIFPDTSKIDFSRTIYAPSVVGDYNSIRVPDVPTLRPSSGLVAQVAFDCPYCGMILDTLEMQNRLAWKRHVFRDLRPYTCTFADCASPDKLFATRHDWIYHEVQLHRRQWKCQECSRSFFDKKEMAAHLRQVHSPSGTERQLLLLLEMSERPMDEAQIELCPFCLATMSLKRLLVHIAEHMEQLALFSLPLAAGETGEAASNAVLERQSRSTSIGDLSSLRFRSASSEISERITARDNKKDKAIPEIKQLWAIKIVIRPAMARWCAKKMQRQLLDIALEVEEYRYCDNDRDGHWFSEKRGRAAEKVHLNEHLHDEYRLEDLAYAVLKEKGDMTLTRCLQKLDYYREEIRLLYKRMLEYMVIKYCNKKI